VHGCGWSKCLVRSSCVSQNSFSVLSFCATCVGNCTALKTVGLREIGTYRFPPCRASGPAATTLPVHVKRFNVSGFWGSRINSKTVASGKAQPAVVTVSITPRFCEDDIQDRSVALTIRPPKKNGRPNMWVRPRPSSRLRVTGAVSYISDDLHLTVALEGDTAGIVIRPQKLIVHQ